MAESSSEVGRDLARIAIFAALIVVLGFMQIPLALGVPITLQTLGVMLAGAILGPRKAPLAVLLVLVLAATGLPVLAGGRGGLGVFVAPSAGYLFGWIVGALVIGLIVHAGKITWWRTALGVVVGGMLVVYLFGIPIVSLVANVDLVKATLGNLAFVPGDLLKAAAATVLTVAVYRAYPRAFGVRKPVAVAPVTQTETRVA